MRLKRALFLLPALFGTLLLATAQEISLTAQVDRAAASVGDPVKYTVTFVNPQSGSTLNPPDMGDLVVLQGPFDSRYSQVINGRASMSVTRTWVVTSTRAGEFTIGPAVGRVGGGEIRTEPVQLRFTKAEGAAVSSQSVNAGQERNRDLFCVISLSKNKVYTGEQVVATYTLYSRYNSLQPGDYEMPKLNGFWAEEVDLGQASWDKAPQTVNGLRYNVATLKKQVLIPQRSGKLRIDPMELTYRVNPTFFSSGTPVSIRSNAAELTVVELPAGRPADMIGAVGELQLTVNAPNRTVKANEAIDLSLRFSGRANLKLIDAPKLQLPPDFESYDPKVVDKVTVSGAGMSGSREFQYLLIPRAEGEHDLGPMTFSYFDPASGQYKQLSTGPLVFTVLPGDGNTATTARPRQTDVQQLGNDIRYIRTGDLKLGPPQRHLFGSLPYLAGMALPVLGLVLLVGWHRKRDREQADATGMRRKGADKVARQRLKAAEQALRGNDREGFYSAVGRALEGYFADRFGLGVAGVNASAITERLGYLENGQVAKAYVDLLNESQLARYAPLENKPRQQVYDEAVALIKRIESAPRA